MTPSETDALRHVAQRVVWFKTPADATADERGFLTHVLSHGTLSDIQTTRRVVGDERIRQALETAPSGVFSPRQWRYWNRFYGIVPVPPMPERRFQMERAGTTPGSRKSPKGLSRSGDR